MSHKLPHSQRRIMSLQHVQYLPLQQDFNWKWPLQQYPLVCSILRWLWLQAPQAALIKKHPTPLLHATCQPKKTILPELYWATCHSTHPAPQKRTARVRTHDRPRVFGTGLCVLAVMFFLFVSWWLSHPVQNYCRLDWIESQGLAWKCRTLQLSKMFPEISLISLISFIYIYVLYIL